VPRKKAHPTSPRLRRARFLDESKRLHHKFKRIGSQAAKKARAENLRLGLPNCFLRDGQIYYELPNGEVTTEDPFNPPAAPDDAR